MSRLPFRVLMRCPCTKSPQHYHRREEFDGTVSTKGKQCGAPRPPSCVEGYHSLYTHPCDCDGLHPLDSPDSVGSSYLERECHSQHYGTVRQHRGSKSHQVMTDESFARLNLLILFSDPPALTSRSTLLINCG